MINCRETGNDILQKFLVFEWLFQADIMFEADRCNHIDNHSAPLDPNPLIVECHIAGQWDVSKERKMIKILQNHAYIKQLVQDLMK